MTNKKGKDHYDKYGWMINEENLQSLPSSAPQAAKDLVKWLTLEGRRKALTEWIRCCADDGKIHGKTWPIGAWTHRMSHSNPNSANIAKPFSGEPKTPVEEIKQRYDSHMRNLWKASEGKVLVGTDLDAAQLRILANVTKSEKLRDGLVSGDKTKGTDAHTVNKNIIGTVCRDRNIAKSFIYGLTFGMGIPKAMEILECNRTQAKEALEKFYRAMPELKNIEKRIKFDAGRGYFIGLDGRKINCDSEFHMLAGYLQSGESIIAKHWIIKWRTMAKASGLKFKQVNFVHDEVQVEVDSMEDAEKLITIQKLAMEEVNKDLGMFCPMGIESKVGKTWLETH